MVRDGIHRVYEHKVYVEYGFVQHGFTGTGVHYKILYPYMFVKNIGWLRCAPPTLAAFRSGIKRGTMRLA